jgi:hypothetical protein
MVGLCTVNGTDISRWMVQQGEAIAFRRHSLDYVVDEDAARAAKVGIWAGSFKIHRNSAISLGRRGSVVGAAPAHVRMTETVLAGDVASEVLVCGQAEQSWRAQAAKTLAASEQEGAQWPPALSVLPDRDGKNPSSDFRARGWMTRLLRTKRESPILSGP